VTRIRGSLLIALLVGLSACGDTTSLPPGRSVLESEIASPIGPNSSAPPTDSLSIDTIPGAPSTTLEPVSSTSELPMEIPSVETGCAPISVPTGSTQITGERCNPGPFFPGARPAVLVLNGCGGYAADGEIGRAIAAALVREGIVAVRIDYLGAAPAFDRCVQPLADLRESAEPILGAVADTAALLRIDPTIDATAMGAVGYSLGGLTALSAVLGGAGLSPIEPVPLSSVALLSFPNLLPELTDGLAAGFGPSLFVVSGDVDDATPPADSEAVVEAAFEGGVSVERLLVPGQDHNWTGPAAALVASVIADELADRFYG
jgi:dienelactone hydrolase